MNAEQARMMSAEAAENKLNGAIDVVMSYIRRAVSAGWTQTTIPASTIPQSIAGRVISRFQELGYEVVESYCENYITLRW